jgi:oligoendopeptidase F
MNDNQISDTALNNQRFDLSDLYKSLTDPKISEDLALLETLVKRFSRTFRSQLETKLGEALEELKVIYALETKLFLFVNLLQACNATDEKIQQLSARIRESWASLSAQHLTFFEQEIGKTLSEEAYQKLVASDPRVKHHASMLNKIRQQAKHMLSEEVEKALRIRSPFMDDEWSEYFDNIEAKLRIAIRGPAVKGKEEFKAKKTLSQAVHVVLHHADSAVRFDAMNSLNKVLKKELAEVTARSLNVVTGLKAVEDSQRGYKTPMESRNINNMVSQSVVDALHKGVIETGGEQARRYFRILAKQFNKKTLLWSDRTASINFPDLEQKKYPWEDGFALVQQCYEKFSPKLGSLVTHIKQNGWIDAPVYPNKTSGAFNYSVEINQDPKIRSYTLLNYLGTEDDVMVVAHEFGHAVHGLLAGEAQGGMMMHAPMVYAETASIFGEMLVFEELLKQSQDPRKRFALLMSKASGFLSSSLRQISFSLFEQEIHKKRKKGKLTTKDYRNAWLKVTKEIYGKEGEIFSFKGMDYMWSYVGHFMRPFYVYAYAFGEILTQSLFAVRSNFGDKFEPLYLDMLKAGSTKDAVALLKPFDLDPEDPSFWARGIRNSLGKWLDEAEALSTKIV